MARQESGAGPQASAAALIDLIRTLLGELHSGKVPVVTLDSVLDRDLGVDSLGRMELLARIEKRFGVTLSPQAFATAVSPRDLLRALAGAKSAADLGTQVLIKAAGVATPATEERVPDQAGTLGEVLDWHLALHPDRPYVRFFADSGEGEVVTYQDLAAGAQEVAAGLQARDLEPGMPVAIMLPTSSDYLFAFFGVLRAGGVPVPIYPPVRKAQLESHLRRQAAILENCGAVILVTFAEALGFARLLRSRLDTLRHLVTVAELRRPGARCTPPVTSPADIAFLQYTSGSTGSPKGVVLSHANLLANIRVMGQAVELREDDVIVSWLPLYHDMGLIGSCFCSLFHAVPLILLSPLDFLSRPQRWLWAIHRYRGTLSPAPNFAYEICGTRLGEEDLAGIDLSTWRGAFNGAEPVSPRTIEGFCRRMAPRGFRREALMPVYGLAECSVGLTFPPIGRGPLIDAIDRESLVRKGRAVPAKDGADPLRFVACGQPLAGHEIRITDRTGRELPERREGRVQFRGPSACSGYYRNPEATRRLFDGDWLDSGDLGYLAAGELYLTGRSKDVVIIAGRNIYPQELEEGIGNIPGVRKGNVAVFGSPDPASGRERLVVVAETRETDPQVRERLGTSINALAVELVGNPPDELVLAPPQTVLKTSSGKVRRAACRDFFERGVMGRRDRFWLQVTRLALGSLGARLRRLKEMTAATVYAGYLWGLFSLTAAASGLAVILLPRRSWRWSVVQGGLRLLARCSGIPVTIQGREHLPRDRPCIVVANHASYLDGYLLIAALSGEFSFVAKAELQQRRSVALVLRRLGTEFVERFDLQQGAADTRRLISRARAGRSLMFFPEGTFTRAPGLRPFHLGAFLAAAETGLPVVPVAIRGTRSILRADSWFPRHGAIGVRIGEPLDPGRAAAEDQGGAWSLALQLRDQARGQILRFCGEPDLARRGP